jgi:hypothetical protein
VVFVGLEVGLGGWDLGRGERGPSPVALDLPQSRVKGSSVTKLTMFRDDFGVSPVGSNKFSAPGLMFSAESE